MRESLTDKVYNGLKTRILKLDFNVNEMLTEKKLADDYGVSKTPAREALNRLCQEGYLVRYPSTGYFIRDLSMKDYKDIFTARRILEAGAIRIIVESSSDDDINQLNLIIQAPADSYESYHEVNTRFHTKLGELSGNSYLRDYIERLNNTMARPSAFTQFNEKTRPSNKWHELIIQSLLEREADKAVEYLNEDILY